MKGPPVGYTGGGRAEGASIFTCAFLLSMFSVTDLFGLFSSYASLLNGPPSGYIGGGRADGASAVVGQLESRTSILLIVSSVDCCQGHSYEE